MKKLALLIKLFLFLPLLIPGQSHFSKSFKMADDTDGNQGFNIQPYEDGYLILAARVNDFGIGYTALAKVGQDGIPEWRQTYYLENQDKPPIPGLSMVIDDDYIYVACQYNNNVTGLDLQMLCIDRNSHDTVWTRQYPRALNDFILQTLETVDNSLIMVSVTRITAGGTLLRITKVDKSGNIIWETSITDFKSYHPWQACIAKDGAVLVAYSFIEFGDFHLKGGLTKIGLDGEVGWTQKFNATEGVFSTIPEVAALDNGDIAFGWVRDTFPPGGTLYAFPPTVFLLDSLGNTKTTHSFYNRWLRALNTLRVLPNGDILGVGSADGHPDSFGTGGWLFRMKPNGELLWQRVIADTHYNGGELIDATPAPDNGILATGYGITKNTPEEVLVWLLKIGGDGCYQSNCTDVELLITPASETPLPAHSYRLYPNPGEEYIYIEGLTGVDEERLDIYNIMGQLEYSAPSPQPGEIDIGNLPPGVYTVKITLKNNLFTTLQLIKP